MGSWCEVSRKGECLGGGRYHFKDDWEFYDTLVANFEYDDRTISQERLSCQGKLSYGKSRGFLICGTRDSILIDGDGYQVFSVDDKKIDEQTVRKRTSSQDLLSIDDMTDEHFRNLIGGIRHGEKLRSPLQLANIAWKVRRTLRLNRNDAHIVDDPEP